MAIRPIDGEELLGITRLLDTDVVRQSKTASWLLDQVLHDIQAMSTLTPPNEPLTLEELREMDEEPVYVVPKDKPAHCGGWCGVTVWKCDRYSYVSLLRDADSGWGFEKYGKTWLAYRRQPEGEA